MISNKLNIVTLITRPENLTHLESSIIASFGVSNHCWHLLPDPRYVKSKLPVHGSHIKVINTDISELNPDLNYFSAGYLRNKITRNLNEGWIWFLDDDNLVDKQFGRMVGYIIEQYGHGKQAFIFTQKHPNGRTRLIASPKNMRLYYVDMAQLLINVDLLKRYRFRENCRTEDGFLIEQIYQEQPDKFMFIDKPLVFFNCLSPDKKIPTWRKITFPIKRYISRWGIRW